MSNIFLRVDTWLLERLFQRIVDELAWHAGLGRIVAAVFCLDIASIAWILSRVPGLSAALDQWNAPVSFSRIGLLGLGLTALICLRILFHRAGRSQRGNPLRPAMRPHRAVALLLLLVRLGQSHLVPGSDWAEIVMLLFSASALYLGACAERPPEQRHLGHRAGKMAAPAAT